MGVIVAEKQFAGRPRYAPEGYHWRCRECGRVSLHDRFGLEPGAFQGKAEEGVHGRGVASAPGGVNRDGASRLAGGGGAA